MAYHHSTNAPQRTNTRPARRYRRWLLGALLLATVLPLLVAGVTLNRVRTTLTRVTQTPLSLYETIEVLIGADLPGGRPLRRERPTPMLDIDEATWQHLRELTGLSAHEEQELGALIERAALGVADGAGQPAALSGETSAPQRADAPMVEGGHINLLILGMRGADDPDGGLLSDAIVLASLDLARQQLTLISLPRDLYVPIPGTGRRHRINAAHAIGELQGGYGLTLARQTVEQVFGLPVHYAASLDFHAFVELVDLLGGIEVEVGRDFVGAADESLALAAGLTRMDGRTALIYATSRRTTNDFDRSRRQREIIQATLQRAEALALHRDPARLLALLESLDQHLRVDASPYELRELIVTARAARPYQIVEFGFDTSPTGLLRATYLESGAYVLLPRDGELASLQAAVAEVLR
jgi:LCP family protein required for cell wall assembly